MENRNEHNIPEAYINLATVWRPSGNPYHAMDYRGDCRAVQRFADGIRPVAF